MKNRLSGFATKIIFASIILFITNFINAQKFENLAPTPPMGWNSWNHFACDINEQTIKEMADVMVSSGMKDVGYVYINIDDCWHAERDSLGFIHPNKERFPSGMKSISDYVHSKGLKLGIYSCAGSKTCAGYPAGRGHEYQDALMYAKWGIDYLKYDWCNTGGLNPIGAYTTMRDALFAAGRPIVFSICEWGDNKPWEWGNSIGHLWRTTGDIYNCFDCVKDHGTWNSWGVMQILDKQEGLRKYAGPDHWNDPDMMEVGNGLTSNENRAHFSMWCMLAAPLIAGNDLTKMDEDVRNILINKDVIAVDQDKLGIQGFKYSSKENVEIWFKPLDNNEWAMCILNRNEVEKEITFDWKNENVRDDIFNLSPDFTQNEYGLKNLWSKKEFGTTSRKLETKIPGRDVLMFRLSKMKK